MRTHTHPNMSPDSLTNALTPDVDVSLGFRTGAVNMIAGVPTREKVAEASPSVPPACPSLWVRTKSPRYDHIPIAGGVVTAYSEVVIGCPELLSVSFSFYGPDEAWVRREARREARRHYDEGKCVVIRRTYPETRWHAISGLLWEARENRSCYALHLSMTNLLWAHGLEWWQHHQPLWLITKRSSKH